MSIDLTRPFMRNGLAGLVPGTLLVLILTLGAWGPIIRYQQAQHPALPAATLQTVLGGGNPVRAVGHFFSEHREALTWVGVGVAMMVGGAFLLGPAFAVGIHLILFGLPIAAVNGYLGIFQAESYIPRSDREYGKPFWKRMLAI